MVFSLSHGLPFSVFFLFISLDLQNKVTFSALETPLVVFEWEKYGHLFSSVFALSYPQPSKLWIPPEFSGQEQTHLSHP